MAAQPDSDEALARHILQALRASSKPLLAREIADVLNRRCGWHLRRHDVNHCLYAILLPEKRVRRDPRTFQWTVVAGGGAPSAAGIGHKERRGWLARTGSRARISER